ncbi:YicC family protein [Heliobacterium undosum]|uniref:YicC family protein n=1 Tax=Heliomicrobium undosum TaxID=121734 RepID=A0A845L1X8_9FIRM|nr:YicC/YloC family endoribonuclease [Heliomicrobium undosum]MZP29039.1 YicC family protein [Heliomicrobium undosum]
MIKSMTGYGRGEACGAGKRVTVEAKAVNHRYSEVVVRLPKTYMVLEDAIKKIFFQGISRGRVDVFVNLETDGEVTRQVKVDKQLALRYYKSLRDLAQELELPCDVGLNALYSLPEVITLDEPEEDMDEVARVVDAAARQALDGLMGMRIQEGNSLAEDLFLRLTALRHRIKAVEERSPFVAEDYLHRLQERIKELLGQTPVDEQRLAMEVALFADRSNITEELVRLNSHLEQFQKALASSEPVGRKLDFLVQEMNREVNTIGSKSNDLEVSRHVVDLKSEMEKIREQVQNVE